MDVFWLSLLIWISIAISIVVLVIVFSFLIILPKRLTAIRDEMRLQSEFFYEINESLYKIANKGDNDDVSLNPEVVAAIERETVEEFINSSTLR